MSNPFNLLLYMCRSYLHHPLCVLTLVLFHVMPPYHRLLTLL